MLGHHGTAVAVVVTIGIRGQKRMQVDVGDGHVVASLVTVAVTQPISPPGNVPRFVTELVETEKSPPGKVPRFVIEDDCAVALAMRRLRTRTVLMVIS